MLEIFYQYNGISKVGVSFLEVRNELGNFRLKFTGFNITNAVLVMYLKMQNSKEATKKNIYRFKSNT